MIKVIKFTSVIFAAMFFISVLSGCIVKTSRKSGNASSSSLSLDTELSDEDSEPQPTPIVIPDYPKTVLIDKDIILQAVSDAVEMRYTDPAEFAFILNRELISSYADTDEKKGLMLSLYSAMLTSQESVDVPEGAVSDPDELKLIMSILDADAPEILHLSEQYKYYTSDGVIVRVCFDYTKTPQEYFDMLKELLDKLDEVLPTEASAYDIELTAHDYIISNCEYDTLGEYNSNAYGAVIDGKAICEGYSDSFTLSMLMRGIKCCMMWGVAKNNEYITESHAWNIVELDGEWYNVDLTWDEYTLPNKQSLYTYFNITDEEIRRNHTLGDDIQTLTLPECTESKYNYHIYNDLYIEKDDDAQEFLYELLDKYVEKGSSSWSVLLKFESESSFDDISGNISSVMNTWINRHSNAKSASYSYVYDAIMYVVLLNVEFEAN